MKPVFIKWTLIVFVFMFILFFAGRAVYSFNTPQDSAAIVTDVYYSNSASDSAMLMKNYASERLSYLDAGSVSVIDQKYERTANIVSKTTNYDSDFSRFQEVLEENKAMVQSENSRGLQGSRRVDLVIGVRPDNFDKMRDEILKIGRVTSSSTTKVDKTYEYRQMLAEKETLENRKAAYEELKSRGGSITELLQLEDKIIEVDTQIQQQQIGLGEYSDENALCTINFTLYEGSAVSAPYILWNALTWTAGVYAALIGVLILIGVAAAIFLHVWGYFKHSLSPRQPVNTSVTNEKQ